MVCWFARLVGIRSSLNPWSVCIWAWAWVIWGELVGFAVALRVPVGVREKVHSIHVLRGWLVHGVDASVIGEPFLYSMIAIWFPEKE